MWVKIIVYIVSLVYLHHVCDSYETVDGKGRKQ